MEHILMMNHRNQVVSLIFVIYSGQEPHLHLVEQLSKRIDL